MFTNGKVFNLAVGGVFAILTVWIAAPLSEVIPINSYADLRKIGKDSNYPLDGSYELTGDIDATPSRSENGGLGFEPIGRYNSVSDVEDSTNAFRGVFDGKGHKIGGLYIKRDSNIGNNGFYVGLFGNTFKATIKNVAVFADSVIGGRYVGALVGRAYGGTISGCYAIGAVVGTIADIGGLVGEIEGTEVTACYTLTTVTATGNGNNVGGLVGSCMGGAVSNCYSMGAVKGISNVGGLVGVTTDGASSVSRIRYCFSAGPVSASGDNAGGFIGNNSGSISGCFWDTVTSGIREGAVSGVVGKSDAEMKSATTFSTWNVNSENGVWGISNNYPYIKSILNYTITFKAAIGGTVSGAATHIQKVNYGIDGAEVSAAISSESGESFIGWFFDDEKLTAGKNCGIFTVAKLSNSGETVALASLSGDPVIEARFALKKFNVTYAIVKGGGKITITDINGADIAETSTATPVVIPVEYGSTIRATATPAVGSNFGRWGLNSKDTSVTRLDTIYEDMSISATFSANELSLVYSGGDNGRVGNGNSGATFPVITPPNVKFGDDGPIIRAVPTNADDYEFVKWSDDVTDNPRQDKSVRVDIDVVAIFKIKSATFKYIAQEGGKIAVEGASDAPTDTAIVPVDYYARGPKITAVPNYGYLFVSWSDNSADALRLGDSTGYKDSTWFAVFEIDPTATASGKREIPQLTIDEAAISATVTITAGEVTVGPNPISKHFGRVNIFYTGKKRIASGTLSVFDASGNLIKNININDNVIEANNSRVIGYWDISDKRNTIVANGAYLLKGTLFVKGGGRERVSIIVGVR